MEAAGIDNLSDENRRNALFFNGLGAFLGSVEWLLHRLIRSILLRYQIMSDQL
jgi:hypothetical protein